MWVNRYWLEHISRFGQPWSRVHAGTVARYCLEWIQPAATVLYTTRNAQMSLTLKHLSQTPDTISIFWEIFSETQLFMAKLWHSLGKHTQRTAINSLLPYVTRSNFESVFNYWLDNLSNHCNSSHARTQPTSYVTHCWTSCLFEQCSWEHKLNECGEYTFMRQSERSLNHNKINATTNTCI